MTQSVFNPSITVQRQRKGVRRGNTSEPSYSTPTGDTGIPLEPRRETRPPLHVQERRLVNHGKPPVLAEAKPAERAGASSQADYVTLPEFEDGNFQPQSDTESDEARDSRPTVEERSIEMRTRGPHGSHGSLKTEAKCPGTVFEYDTDDSEDAESIPFTGRRDRRMSASSRSKAMSVLGITLDAVGASSKGK